MYSYSGFGVFLKGLVLINDGNIEISFDNELKRWYLFCVSY